MSTASIELTSYNMGDVTDSDYAGWVAFVAAHIDDRCGFGVDVEASRFGQGSGRDRVFAKKAEEEEVVREALEALWEDWSEYGWEAWDKERAL